MKPTRPAAVPGSCRRFHSELRFVEETEVSIGHKRKRWSHQVQARQTELCSVNVTVDSKVTFANWRHYFVNFNTAVIPLFVLFYNYFLSIEKKLLPHMYHVFNYSHF